MKTWPRRCPRNRAGLIAKGDESAEVVEFAKGADEYSEYALSIAAVKASDREDHHRIYRTAARQNNKSKHVDTAATYYLAALAKEERRSNPLQRKILGGVPKLKMPWMRPLAALAAAHLAAAVAVMQRKPSRKGSATPIGPRRRKRCWPMATILPRSAPVPVSVGKECDAAFKAGDPYFKGQPAMQGTSYFYQGLAQTRIWPRCCRTRADCKQR